jgi:uncharacterized protein
LFAEYGVRVGISLDGDRAANDRHRLYANGRSSYDQVVRAISLLRTDRFRSMYAGLLCTVDVANDPVAVYDALIALSPPRIDFLLPHATWDEPPPRDPGRDEQYADWLIAIFDRWLADGRPTRIRTFESILSTLAGGDSSTEALGLAPSSLAVIETDGSYEQVDSLKVAYAGAPDTGFDVFSDELDVVMRHPGIVARQRGLDGLSQTCRECPVVASCGGGLYAHRYRSGSGFENPSVFCADLFKLISHAKDRLPQQPGSHALPDEDFRDLASGRGRRSAVRQLINGQRTIRRTLLTTVYQAASGHAAVNDTARSGLRAAWGVLAAAEAERPEVLGQVLDHPFVRSWAVRCLAQLEALAADPAAEFGVRAVEVSLGYVSALAASSAIRAGISAELTIPVADSAVSLPTLGRLVLGPDERQPLIVRLILDGHVAQFQVGEDWLKLAVNDLARVDVEPVLVGDDHRTASWQARRFLRAPGLTVALEDGDPYRDCFGPGVAPHLSREQFADWQRAFTDAWAEIAVTHSAYAPAIEAGLNSLVPLRSGLVPDGAGVAERDAFGAIAVPSPADPARWGHLIVAAVQQAKLGAILDLFDLYDPDAPDARATAEMLTRAYGQLATGSREAVAETVEILTSCAGLTEVGRRFVAEMKQSV